MAHGAPDNYQVKPKITTYTLDDMAELAVRLGSPDYFNRLGDVVHLDSFENGIAPLSITGMGTGNVQKIVSSSFKSGGFSLKLVSGSTLLRYSQITKLLPYPTLSKFGFEVGISLGSGIETVNMGVTLYDGINYSYAEITYNDTNNKLQYKDENLTYQDIATDLDLNHNIDLFHIFKLVADFVNLKYIKVILNNTVYPLSSIAIWSSASSTEPHLSFAVNVISSAGSNGTIYVDDIIITQNEP